jgi:hypothetical protein
VILVRVVGFGCVPTAHFYFRFSRLAIACKSKATFDFLKHVISGGYVEKCDGQYPSGLSVFVRAYSGSPLLFQVFPPGCHLQKQIYFCFFEAHNFKGMRICEYGRAKTCPG